MTRANQLTKRIRKELCNIAGVLESPGTFSHEQAYWVNAKEIAHFHDGDLEPRLTRSVFGAHRERLRADARIERRAPSSDWIIVRCQSMRDVALVRELAELAAAAHQPPPGVPPELPPTGAALERRRRFH